MAPYARRSAVPARMVSRTAACHKRVTIRKRRTVCMERLHARIDVCRNTRCVAVLCRKLMCASPPHISDHQTEKYCIIFNCASHKYTYCVKGKTRLIAYWEDMEIGNFMTDMTNFLNVLKNVQGACKVVALFSISTSKCSWHINFPH